MRLTGLLMKVTSNSLPLPKSAIWSLAVARVHRKTARPRHRDTFPPLSDPPIGFPTEKQIPSINKSMIKLNAALWFVLWLLVVGCSQRSSLETADKLSELARKMDQIIAKDAELKQLASKIDQLASRLPAPTEPSTIDSSKLKRENTTDLAWLLITKDPKEKADLVNRRVVQSTIHTQATQESIQTIVTDIEGLNVVLNAPEGLDLTILQQAEEARNRLVELLRKEIPRIVREIDAETVKTFKYVEAKRLWSQSSAVLGFYPASSDPLEAGRIQEMVSSHDLIRARIELAQQQRYNLWACQQIRKAWLDFEASSDPGARMSTCLNFLGPIHPGLLEPVSLELYRDFAVQVGRTGSVFTIGVATAYLASKSVWVMANPYRAGGIISAVFFLAEEGWMIHQYGGFRAAFADPGFCVKTGANLGAAVLTTIGFVEGGKLGVMIGTPFGPFGAPIGGCIGAIAGASIGGLVGYCGGAALTDSMLQTLSPKFYYGMKFDEIARTEKLFRSELDRLLDLSNPLVPTPDTQR